MHQYHKSKDEHIVGLYRSILKNSHKYTEDKEFILKSKKYSHNELEEFASTLTWACMEIEPKEFEELVSFWFNKCTPYETTLADNEYEMQYDIRGVWKGEGEAPVGEKYIAIQCKKWAPSMQPGQGKITMNTITQIYGKADKIIARPDTRYAIVTTTYLNEEARKYADDHNIYCVDFSQIPMVIKDAEEHGFFKEKLSTTKRKQSISKRRFNTSKPDGTKGTNNGLLVAVLLVILFYYIFHLIK